MGNLRLAVGSSGRANLESSDPRVGAESVGFPFSRRDSTLVEVVNHPAADSGQVSGDGNETRNGVGVLGSKLGLDLGDGILEDALGSSILLRFDTVGGEQILCGFWRLGSFQNRNVPILWQTPTSRARSDTMALRDDPSTTWSTHSYIPTISAANSLSACGQRRSTSFLNSAASDNPPCA